MQTFHVKRESQFIWSVRTTGTFWSDGSALSARLAFDQWGDLSSNRAQTLDRENGVHSILVTPFRVTNTKIKNAARELGIGETTDVTLP